jgi:Holliday junction DNA helicase RuvA
MIGRLAGSLVSIRGERLLVDVAGVGYEISVTAKVAAGLGGPGDRTVVWTHLHVREDAMNLFGFPTEADRDLFRTLLTAQGVGPKVALAMLGSFSADALRRMVAAEDVDSLVQVPGIGRRSAQKIILDLKPRLADMEADVLVGDSPAAQLREALESLGYAPAEIRSVTPMVDASLPIAEQVRQALKELAR